MKRPIKWVPSEGTRNGSFVDAEGDVICHFGDEEQYYPAAGGEPTPEDIEIIVNAVNSI